MGSGEGLHEAISNIKEQENKGRKKEMTLFEQLMQKVEGVKNDYSFCLFLLEHLKDFGMVNCKGIQEHPHKCLLEGEGLSKEMRELPCGCKDMLLHCNLVVQIKYFQEKLVPHLQTNKEWSLDKYEADRKDLCPKRSQFYEYSSFFQSLLRQYFNNPTLLTYFALDCKPKLEDRLYQRLKLLAQKEDTLICDNSEDLEFDLGIQKPVSEIYKPLQEQLLLKLERVKS